ncbi:MAG: metallophosphoesterase family protein [Thermodesulfovibrionales bacterium]
MKILYASDIHVNKNHLGTLLGVAEREQVGAVVIGGDIVPKVLFHTYGFNKLVIGQRKYLENEFIAELRTFREKNPGIKVFLDLGNDDFSANRDVLETAEAEGLFHLLHMAVHPLTDDLDIVGYMGVPITPFGIKDWERPDKKGQFPPPETGARMSGYVSTKEGGTGLLRHTIDVNKDTSIEEELAELGKKITKQFIFVCHTPPYLTNLDALYSGEHVGSVAVREFIEEWANKGLLRASFHGHIHESPKVSGSDVDVIAGIECRNPGQTENELSYVVWESDHPLELTPGR